MRRSEDCWPRQPIPGSFRARRFPGGYDPATTVIGSGPFIVHERPAGRRLQLQEEPRLARQAAALRRHDEACDHPRRFDATGAVRCRQLDELAVQRFDIATVQQQHPNARCIKVAERQRYPLYFQMGDPTSPFMDIASGAAISMSIDRDAIEQGVFNGRAESVVYVPGYMGKWAMSIDQARRRYAAVLQVQPRRGEEAARRGRRSRISSSASSTPSDSFPTPSTTKRRRGRQRDP